MKIRCIAIDDSEFDLIAIKDCINQCGDFNLLQTFQSAKEAANFLSKNEVDLIFSDIEMPELNGLQMIRNMNNPPTVVFVTSHPELAIEGYDVSALDFLKKPIQPDRWLQTIERIKDHFSSIKSLEFHQQNQVDAAQESRNYFVIKSDGELIKIVYHDLIFVEANADFTNIVTTKNKYHALVNLKNLHLQLPVEFLVRCHKSFSINLGHVEKMSATTLVMSNQMILPLGNEYREKLEMAFMGNRLIRRKADHI